MRSPSSLLKPPTRNRILSKISYFFAFAENNAFLIIISVFLLSFSVEDSNSWFISNTGGCIRVNVRSVDVRSAIVCSFVVVPNRVT